MDREALAEKIVIVTGAGSGIGQATAVAAARCGAAVAVVDRDLAAAGVTAATIRASSEADAEAIRADVADEHDVQAMIDCVRERFGGRVDVLANVAGIGSTTTAVDTELATWEEVFAVNARGVFLCCKHALRVMIAQGSGTIVNVASVAGLVGLRNRAAYCASKGAVIAFTKALAIDHIRDGIRVNCVCPGTVDTPWVERLVGGSGESREALAARQPMGRLGQPEEIAHAIVYLASDAASFATGSTHVVDGGLTAA